MGFENYAAQAPQANKLAVYEFFGLRNANGTHPKVHVEFIDDKAWNAHIIGLAGVKDDAEVAKRHRDLVARHVRKIEDVYHADGSVATEADIAPFIRKIPDFDFGRLFSFARNDTTFRQYADPEEVAGK